MTSPLPQSASHNFGARERISQYGHGEVQKFTISSGTPMVASRGADNANVPSARYAFQRAMARSKCPGPGPEGRDLTSSSAAKSGGVTSDTNQGMDLGLRDRIRVCYVATSRRWGTDWKTTLEMYGVWDTRKSAKIRSVKSCDEYLSFNTIVRRQVKT